ncbi:branched-chain amino acid transport system II carrier protein [Companilactobacillus allii]|uniref:Branched-chain amino acid transport system carrier protein n=1 Tax=Companilactobacillus allii TaxID=1847728 RepID=A0A1P8Q3K6_9LACO|nr:branched-chain amino acid transport system II carrier protein [Companilactobacillus allii]APX72436.1 branched-chain amino acid transport system II carrier protein [Companilactobacillus allii]USQ69531.1 branched-chain amino acid transport system II carrier protein [Companilactobacillus allii]
MQNDLLESKSNKSKFLQLLVVSSLIFGMFFGSGNLIFPVHLGQMAGNNWFAAAIGFAISGSLFPLLAILAVVVTKSDGLYDLARPVGKRYAALFLVLVHLTIGPFFGTPRTAATAFEMAAKPFLPAQYNQVSMLIFTAVFFSLAYVLSVHQNRLVKYVGKYLNTIFLALLAVIFVVAFVNPMGGLNHMPTTAYQTTATVSGLLEGYNTVDAVALLALSVTFVRAVKGLGYKNKELSTVTAKAGTMAISLEVLVYLGLVLLGAFSLNKMKLSANGGDALSSIVGDYFGNFGAALLGVLVTLGVFTTALGLVASFAQDFHKLFPKVSYLGWLRVTCFVSFVVANAGLDTIISWSLPVLMLLYPLSLALILTSLTVHTKSYKGVVYKMTIAFTVLPAVLDMFNAAPAVLQTGFVKTVLNVYHQYLPFASMGLGWVTPTLLGFVLGMVLGKMGVFVSNNEEVTQKY